VGPKFVSMRMSDAPGDPVPEVRAFRNESDKKRNSRKS